MGSHLKFNTYEKGLEAVLIIIIKGVGDADALQKHILRRSQPVILHFQSNY